MFKYYVFFSFFIDSLNQNRVVLMHSLKVGYLYFINEITLITYDYWCYILESVNLNFVFFTFF
jgi:hypothetical protein